jgi:Anti-sigma-K factor rskA, C-terminal
MTDDDLVERRAIALEADTMATADLDQAERKIVDRVRGMLAHPAVWLDPPDLPVHPAALETPAEVVAAPAAKPKRSRRLRWGLAAAVATGVAAAVLAMSIVAWPRHETVRFALTGTDQVPAARASVTATKLDAGWRVKLDTDDLPGAPQGTYYQGWVVRDGDYVPLGTFHLRQPGEVELWAGVALDEFTRLEVTRQRVGGGQTPGELVMVGAIPNR